MAEQDVLVPEVAVYHLAGRRAGIASFLPGERGGEMVGEVGQPRFGGRPLPGADAPCPGADGFDQAVGGDVVGEAGCHISGIFGKLQVAGRAEAIIKAGDGGLDRP